MYGAEHPQWLSVKQVAGSWSAPKNLIYENIPLDVGVVSRVVANIGHHIALPLGIGSNSPVTLMRISAIENEWMENKNEHHSDSINQGIICDTALSWGFHLDSVRCLMNFFNDCSSVKLFGGKSLLEVQTENEKCFWLPTWCFKVLHESFRWLYSPCEMSDCRLLPFHLPQSIDSIIFSRLDGLSWKTHLRRGSLK